MSWEITFLICVSGMMGFFALGWCFELSQRLRKIENEEMEMQKFILEEMQERRKIYKNSPPSE